MGSQFYHVNAYGRQAGKGKQGKHTIDSIIDEAERARGSYPHIENVHEPVLLWGCSPRIAGELAKEWAQNSKDSRGHCLRKDAHCLLAGVISVPEDFSQENWVTYKKESIKFLQDKFQERLKSVIEHTDEEYRHIHFYVVANEQERFEEIHEGIKAQNRANPDRGRKTLNKEKVEKQIDRKLGNYAYNTAMRKEQDLFWINVSSRFGLSRIGPKRKRLTRKEILEQKQRENEIVLVYEKVEQLKGELSQKYSDEKTLLHNRQKNELKKLQQEYLERQKGLTVLENKAKKDISTALELSDYAQQNNIIAQYSKRMYDQGNEILNKKIDNMDFDENDVPKPRFLEPATKYSERVYHELRSIAYRYKKQTLEKLPSISKLQMKNDEIQSESKKKDATIFILQNKLSEYQNMKPEHLIELANKRKQETENAENQQQKKHLGR